MSQNIETCQKKAFGLSWKIRIPTKRTYQSILNQGVDQKQNASD